MIFLSCVVAGFFLLSMGSMSTVRAIILVILIIVSVFLLVKEATK